MARGSKPIQQLDDIRAPMDDVLKLFQGQLAELQRYKARFGELDDHGVEEVDEDSDTEQE